MNKNDFKIETKDWSVEFTGIPKSIKTDEKLCMLYGRAEAQHEVTGSCHVGDSPLWDFEGYVCDECRTRLENAMSEEQVVSFHAD